MKPRPAPADYAAIAVAPVLIFVMISALASFLMLLLYDGDYPGRVTWTTLMYTMGAVAIARIAIEQNRAYSLGYATALAAATLVVMVRFVGSPIFCLFILAVIAYLADVIVRDCTIIDETVDASDQGLIDAGRLFVRQQSADSTSQPTQSNKRHQPGRTVMFLAAAALPLFGLGQFLLDRDSATYAMAVHRLLIYLFAALALLVTTSFLGLRRYLRQRGAEMPGEVTVSWLVGGLAVTAAVLGVAFVVPRPGAALASFDLSPLADKAVEITASRWGWGDEGAERSRPDATTTTEDPTTNPTEIHSETARAGGKPGDVGDGNRDNGPAGKQSGGKEKSSGGKGQQPAEDPSSQRSSQSAESKSKGNQSGGQQSTSGPQQSAEQSAAEQSAAEQSPAEQSPAEQSPAERSKAQPDDREQGDSDQRESASASRTNDDRTESDSARSSGPTDAPQDVSNSADNFLSRAANGFGALLKWSIAAMLAAIVASFIWQNWQRLVAWWRDLWGHEASVDADESARPPEAAETPPRPFASFRNPIGSESDPRRVVVMTFQAFEAWAREQGARRSRDETPAEFVRRTARTLPDIGPPAAELVNAYNRIVYGRGKATQRDVATAGTLWQLMNSRPGPGAVPIAPAVPEANVLAE